MHPKLKILIESEEENSKCFDCNNILENPWTSLNHGIFICDNCCKTHKGFEPEISSVRSCTSGNF